MAEPSAVGRMLGEAIERYGLTQRQAGAMLGVSDRMVRQVLRGERPGTAYESAVRQLHREGRIERTPTRREQRVRAPHGRTVPVEKVPADARFHVETGGRSQTVIEAPSRGLGRESAKAAVLRDLRARRGGARGRGGRRVTIRIRTKVGNTWTLGGKGGYDPLVVARRMQDEGDPFDWLADEANSIPGCSSPGMVLATNIASVTLTYF